MAWWASLKNAAETAVPYLLTVAVIAGLVVIVEFLPARGAAAALGSALGALFTFLLTERARRGVQIAAFWFAVAVAADAAFAKLNDVVPFTIANALMKVVDAILKLADPLLRGLGLGAPDPRVKIGAVTPDFVWAVILSLIVLMILAFNARSVRPSAGSGKPAR